MLNSEYEELVEQSRSTWLTSQYPLKAKVTRWLKFFDARGESGLDDMFVEYADRFLSEGTLVTKRWFVFANEIREIVKKRAEAIPTDMTVTGENEALTQFAQDALGSRVYGDGKTFWQQQEAFNLYCEKTGNLVLVLAPVSDNPTKFKVVRMPTGDMDVRYNSDNIEEVLEYKFSWQTAYSNEKGNPAIADVEYYVNREEYRYVVDNVVVSQIPHKLPFLPVVHVTNEAIDNNVIGESVIEALIEPQLQINAVASDIRMANRMGVFPVLYGTVDPETFLFGPGSYTPVGEGQTVDRVENETDTAQLRLELQGDYSMLYRKGRVSMKDEQEIKAFGNTPSGKALLVLNQDGIQYIETRVKLLQAAWEDMLIKIAVIAGKITDTQYKNVTTKIFTVSYADLSLEDPVQLTKEFELILKLYALGKISTLDMLQIGQKKGIVPADWEPADIITQAEEEAVENELKKRAAVGLAEINFQNNNNTEEEEDV